MQNTSNFRPTSGITPPASAASSSSHPPSGPRASEIASISRSLEIGRLLYELRRRNPGLAGSEPRFATPFPPTTQPAFRASFSPPERQSLGVPSPFPVQPEIRIPFPLPARPDHLRGIQSSPQPTSPIPQSILSSTTTHLSRLIPSVSSETQRMPSGDVAPTMGSRVTPSLPSFLTSGAAPARGYDADVVLGPRSGQGDSRNANVLIRGLAIRTIGTLLVIKAVDYIEQRQWKSLKVIDHAALAEGNQNNDIRFTHRVAANTAASLAEVNEAALETEALAVTPAMSNKLLIDLNKLCGVNVLLESINAKVSYVVQDSIVAITDIFQKYRGYLDMIPKLCEGLDELGGPNTRGSLIWVIIEYARNIRDADTLGDKASGKPDAVACFDFDFVAQKEQTLANMLVSPLKQIIGGLDGIPEDIVQPFKDQKKVSVAGHYRFRKL
ncbi:hypothetical protein HOY80DRAFT_1141680 [Tuber brumale]|nr:hypothetical protein HOY80DRAFT_1141680 [Tuber brumale]